MADDYEYDADGVLDFDDGWLYVEDEFDLADELAEGQIPDPGYSGTNYELNMDGYEFDLYAYWDDLEYADDSYWDYGSSNSKPEPSETVGQKRKRGVAKTDVVSGKRRKAAVDEPLIGESEPLVFRSQAERYRSYKQAAPLQKGKPTYSFLSDWRERFADDDGVIASATMPADMRRAAEAHDETPPKVRQLGEEAFEGEEGDDWEDEDEDNEHEGGSIEIDPEMLKMILKEKLGAAGLDGMNENDFMQTIQKMMSGEADGDDVAGDLASSLLGKLTSDTGDEALSGWLSQQGVSLEDDDASSVATAELPQVSRDTVRSRQTMQTSPPDSAVEFNKAKETTTQMPLHSGSPSTASKKRTAPKMDAHAAKKQKKVQFDMPPSSEAKHEIQEQDTPTGEDPLVSMSSVAAEGAASAKAANSTALQANQTISETSAAGEGTIGSTGRKRKASAVDEKPVGKKPKMKELQNLGPLPEAPSPAPPAKRTRSAKSRARQ